MNRKKEIINNEKVTEEKEKILETFMVQGEKKPLKILLSLYKGHVADIVKSLIFFILKSSPEWVIPILTAQIIDLALLNSADSIKKILIRIGVLVLFLVQNYFTFSLHIKYYSKVNRQVEVNLRSAIITKVQHLSFRAFKNMKAGKIQNKIIRDVETVEEFASSSLTQLVTFVINMSISITVIVLKKPIMVVLMLVTAASSIIVTNLFRKKISQTNHEFRVEMENTSSEIFDMVHLIPVTKAHALENKEINKVTKSIINAAQKGYGVSVANSKLVATTWITFTFFQILCLAISAIMACKKMISIGDITLFQSYYTTIISSLSCILSLIPMFTKGYESIKSIGEILSVDDMEENENKIKIENLRGEYEFKNTHFSYDENNAVINGIDLKVNAGETVAFVGGSGAGKSTIMNMITGFYLPDEGEILVDGKNIEEIDLHSYRKHISVVPQSSILFSGTIRDNITYGVNDVTDEEFQRVIEEANLSEFIETLPHGIDTDIGEYGDNISGGQKQRISIARALLRNPSVIIFDEATSALDNKTERQIQEAIDNLTGKCTTFVVAHRLSTIKNADKIVVMKEGKICEIGTYDELLEKKGEFYTLKTL